MRLGEVSKSGAHGLRLCVLLPVAARGSKAAKERVAPLSRKMRAGWVGSRIPGLLPVRLRGIGWRDGPGANDIAVVAYDPVTVGPWMAISTCCVQVVGIMRSTAESQCA